MSNESINALIDNTHSKEIIEELSRKASVDFEFFTELWAYAKHFTTKKAWRAMWIIDKATEKKNDFILPILDELYELVLTTNNESYIRHGMKLILRCPINEEFASPLLTRSIEWMNNLKAKISTQALGLFFFFETAKVYPELKGELSALIETIEEREISPGYRICLRNVKKALK